MGSLRLIPVVVVAAQICAPAAASAQEPVSSFNQLNTRLKVGDKIRVLTAGGKGTKGILEAIEADSLTLRQGTREPTHFPAARVREVHTYVSDSLMNGILVGTALGVAAGYALIASAGGDGTDSWMPILGGFAAVGALIGGTIDHQRVRPGAVLYCAPGARSSTHLSVAALITRSTKGVAVSFSF